MNHDNWKLKMKLISKTFFKGLIAIIPFTLTLYLLFWFAGTIELSLGDIFKFFFPDHGGTVLYKFALQINKI